MMLDKMKLFLIFLLPILSWYELMFVINNGSQQKFISKNRSKLAVSFFKELKIFLNVQRNFLNKQNKPYKIGNKSDIPIKYKDIRKQT